MPTHTKAHVKHVQAFVRNHIQDVDIRTSYYVVNISTYTIKIESYTHLRRYFLFASTYQDIAMTSDISATLSCNQLSAASMKYPQIICNGYWLGKLNQAEPLKTHLKHWRFTEIPQ